AMDATFRGSAFSNWFIVLKYHRKSGFFPGATVKFNAAIKFRMLIRMRPLKKEKIIIVLFTD
ncbi:MAG TPA: hypothetical protein PKL85_11275, partial [Bacteroidia bacterium]|nr:hypothetical protein [Bacteroidia bacterium]